MSNSRYNELKQGSLRDKLKFLFQDSFIYGGGAAVSRALAIISAPILTRIFSKEEFGIVDGISILASLFAVIIIFGQDSAIVRFFYETDSEEERKQIIAQGLLTELILVALVALPLYFHAGFFLETYLSTTKYIKSFQVLIAALPFQIVFLFCQNLLKWTFSRTRYLILSIGFPSMVVFLSLFNVLVLDTGVIGVFYAQLTGFASLSVMGVFFCRKLLERPKHLKYLSGMLQFGWPYMLIGVLCTLIPAADRYFIAKYLNLEFLGVYAVGLKIATMLELPIQGFQTAWGPFAFALYQQQDAQEIYNKVLFYYILILSFIGFLLCSFSKIIILIFASYKYIDSLVIMIPLVYGIIIDSISSITGIGIALSKRTYYTAIIYFCGILITVISIWILIKPFGILGVAYGAMIGQISLTFLKTYFGQRLFPIKFFFKPILLLIILSYICSFISYKSMDMDWYINFLISLITFVVMTLSAWYFVVPRSDKVEVVKWFGQQKLLKTESEGVIPNGK